MIKDSHKNNIHQFKRITIDCNELPILITFSGKNKNGKEYVLKTNQEKTKLLLNKKEY